MIGILLISLGNLGLAQCYRLKSWQDAECCQKYEKYEDDEIQRQRCQGEL